MKKIWYLSTCDTCKRIIKELGIEKKDPNWEFWDLKDNPIPLEDLKRISSLSQRSFEELFNKRAQKYSKTELKDKLSSEDDFKQAILEEYTFLKRPIILIDTSVFIGNSKKTIEEIKNTLN
jgi:arsenate reductase